MTGAPERGERKLFGTDGVRGPVGELITADLALALGRASASTLGLAAPRVLVIRDTRESGEMLEAALAAGVAAAGGEALLGGILPTPAAPLLLRRYGFDLAAVLSASHNHFEDNGIKFFGADGNKLSDAAELAIEQRLEGGGGGVEGTGAQAGAGGARAQAGATPGAATGRIRTLHGTFDDYLRALAERFSTLDLAGLDVLLDCANGATFRAAPEIFRRLGASVSTLADEPDGRNINLDSGSTHVERLAEAVPAGGHEVGFAFDGDGDRVLAVDRHGAVVDGDELIALAALHLREARRLPGDGVAVTVMTNYGFHAAMQRAGIAVATTAVGDRYVLEELLRRGWALGGEQSGHVIELGFAPSGDGIASALLTLEALRGSDLADRAAMEKLPQRLVNVRVRDRRAAQHAPPVREAIEREQGALEGRGRVLVRPSGTEALVRVMVEAPSAEEADEVCGRLVDVVRAEAGE